MTSISFLPSQSIKRWLTASLVLVCFASIALLGFQLIGGAGTVFGYPAGLPEAERVDRRVRYLSAVVFFLTAGFSYLLSVAAGNSLRSRQNLLRLFFLASLLSGAHYLVHAGYEGEWYKLEDVMSFRAEVPFGHRLLFVWLGLLLRALMPDFANLHYFFATQVLAMIAAGYALYRWTGLFVGRELASLSCLIGLLMWIATYSYYTFYDIGIVAFYAGCLYLIYTRRWTLYVILFGVGTLNHEIMLLLVPLSVIVYKGAGHSRKDTAWFLMAQLAVYSLIRLIMFHVLPQPAAFNWHLPINIQMMNNQRAYVFRSVYKLALWYGLALIAVRFAPQRLRATQIILPLLAFTTTLFGRYSEARQFDAFIPAATAFILCLVSAAHRGSATRALAE